jgi:hypothetical protein
MAQSTRQTFGVPSQGMLFESSDKVVTAISSRPATIAGASRVELSITRKPALAPSPQPRPAPTGQALIARNVGRGGPDWMPIGGPDRTPIDRLRDAERFQIVV